MKSNFAIDIMRIQFNEEKNRIHDDQISFCVEEFQFV